MSTNTTVLLSQTTKTIASLLPSENLVVMLNITLRYAILPCASLLGITGNVTTIVILTRRGFRKCSNILLLSLAVSDISILIGINNFPYYINSETNAFRFSEIVNCVCYILHMLFSCFYDTGVFSAVFIHVFITGERILAILFPPRASLFLTPRRTITCVTCLCIVSGAYSLYFDILCSRLKQFVGQGVTIEQLLFSDMCANHIRSGVFDLAEQIINYLTGIIPIIIVTLGCAIIALKILQITNRRRHLTSRQVKATTKHGTTKTTKTLLSICALYIVCHGFASSVLYSIDNTPQELETPYTGLTFCVENILMCINSTGDFIIYASVHTRFRKTIFLNQELKT